ncbi:MAG: U32 family peptidase [Desulfitobacteriaceae bacterium]|nr:U32 family peptidase [Desulfitobacteriaceae bacterium]
MKKPELLAPAGNLEKLEMAISFGADAVYLGGKSFGLRSGAGNFSQEEMKEGIELAHGKKARVYVAVNVFTHNNDLAALPDYLKELEELNVDGIIVSDPGVFLTARNTVPTLPVHISTQANTTNWAAVGFWQEAGAKRVVLARELSRREICEIRQRSSIELEVFVHGAMCISYSGRCLLSNYLAERNANQGDCAHPCRWKYHLVEEKRPGQYWPVFEDERGTYVFNSKDLCLLQSLPELIDCGIDSFKIEGRMKSAFYVASVVKVYREAIDTIFSDSEKFFQKLPGWQEELLKVSHRGYTTGFFHNKPSKEDQRYSASTYIKNYDFIGVVIDYDSEKQEVLLEQRNRFFVGEEIEFLPPRRPFIKWSLDSIKDDTGAEIESAPHPQQLVTIPVPFRLEPGTIMRRARQEES